MQAGIMGKKEWQVEADRTALAMGSGTLPVLATPALVLLMEQAAQESVAAHIGEGESTVGTDIHVRHLAATPVGMRVWCESELTAVEGRKLTFAIRAFDEKGIIGEATHERFIVDGHRFMDKARAKLAKDW